MPNQTISYQVDAADNIISIGGSWRTFAKNNGGEALVSSPPIGQSLWTFINGLSTRFIYQMVISQVRQTKKPLLFPFRCDSPTTLRYMDMEIAPGAGDTVWFRTLLKREIGLPPFAIQNKPAPQEKSLIKMCAWCKMIWIHDNWLTLEDAIWLQGLLDTPEVAPITHGICPDCNNSVQAEIESMKGIFQNTSV